MITYDERASVDDATAWLNAIPYSVAAPGGAPLDGVGDQALLWGRFTNSGSATIYFRKNRGTVSVVAPSVGIATTVAQLIAAQIY